MEKIESLINRYLWLFLIIISIPAIWALLVPGYFGASDDLHVAWLFEMDRALKLGQIPPRFVPDLSYQFGYPLFNFVFPLPFYLGEIFHLLGLNLVDSIKAVFLISVPLSLVFMYQLLRQFAQPLVSLAGATLYVYTPYRANDLYNRGAIGEILGFMFLPLVAWCLIKAIEEKKIFNKWVGWAGLSIGGLILTHDITAYMFFPLLAILGALYWFLNQKRQTLINLLSMAILGLLISSYFWLPAIIDSKLVKYDTVFNFQDHFPTLKQLIKPYWGYGASVPGPYDGMSFFVGLINWLGFLSGIIIFILFKKKFSSAQKIIVSWGCGVFLLALIMMNYRSTFLWQHLPELPYFQFPWRFLILTTFTSSLFFICLEKIKYSKQLAIILIFAVVIINAYEFRPHDFLGRTDSYYLNKYIPQPSASAEYKLTQEEYLRLPQDTAFRPDKIYPSFWTNENQELAGQGRGLSGELNVTLSHPQMVNFNKYNFPGWTASLDGNPARINSGYPFGQVSIGVPSGYHHLEIKFTETNFKIFLDLLSLTGLLLALRLIIKPLRSKEYD